MTRRFDRTDDGKKIHMQTLGALGHYDFNMAGAYSYEQAAHIIRKLDMGIKEIKELYRRMVFNVLMQNNDDHVKNISFLMDKTGSWSLAPAYDMTYAYNPAGAWTNRHQMTVCGKRDNISREDLLQSAETMGLNQRNAKEII